MTKPLDSMSEDDILRAVAERYSHVATDPAIKHGFPVGRTFAENVGYPPDRLDKLPPSTWESFTGAGNPQPFVNPEPGNHLLDLGSGAGLDACIYALAVGPTGAITGLDASHAMTEKAERAATSLNLTNTTFICAQAHNIPLQSNSLDLITANGIFNLSPDKDAIAKEALRLLKPGARLVFAEIILKAPLPKTKRTTIDDWFRCIGGADTGPDLLDRLQKAGFTNARILQTTRNARTGHELSLSAVIEAQKPR